MKNNNKKGFTLIELLIFMGILSILLVVLTQIFTSIIDLQLESETSSSIQQDGRHILARLNYDIARTTTITVPAELSTTTDCQTTNPCLNLTINGTTFEYTVTDGNLTLTTTNGTDNLNSTNTTVSNMTVQRLGNNGGKNSLKILFTLTSRVLRPSGPEIKQFETTIGLRYN